MRYPASHAGMFMCKEKTYATDADNAMLVYKVKNKIYKYEKYYVKVAMLFYYPSNIRQLFHFYIFFNYTC